MAAVAHISLSLHGRARSPSVSPDFGRTWSSPAHPAKLIAGGWQRVGLAVKDASRRLLDAFVDSVFQFVDQPILPSQSNFAPVDEIGDAVILWNIEGEIPVDFPEGVYIRNGSNPLFGALQQTVSVFGRSSYTWVEGEGMLHALYFTKDAGGNWHVSYKNRYVESDTFTVERQRKKPCFLPALEGDSPAILAAYLLNQLRFGKVNKYISNTSVFEHAGRYYSVSESDIPQEIDVGSLETCGTWDVDGAWDRPFTSHPKRAPGTGELVVHGVDGRKPYFVLGVVSADGTKLIHKADLMLQRGSLCHEIGVTERYNVILDMPLIVDIKRLIRGGPLMKYEKDAYSRIGVMPRFGDASSIKWFEVKPYCMFHIINCFEDGFEVVVRGCKARGSIIPGPDLGVNKFEWFSRGFKPIVSDIENMHHSVENGLFFSQSYEWRLNMKTGEVKERNLTGDFSMDFPVINEQVTGLYNNYAYTQVVNLAASSMCALPKYGSLAKLYFEEEHRMPKFAKQRERDSGDLIKAEYHRLGENHFCTGAAFVPKQDNHAEDDGWVVSFVHNEDSNISQVYIIDARRFEKDPVAKITLPRRVPYGFHGSFFSKHTIRSRRYM
uniref:Carotenoid 9,10(9',10')-cleavage dioxygenase 1 n=1 Tax=Anthurium amnicola TaxID=1678845 RepID=A0A1D1Z9R2_9ARAE